VAALSVDGRRLSGRPSVCPVPDPKSWIEGYRKLKIGRNEAHDRESFRGRKVKGQRSKIKVITSRRQFDSTQP